MILFIPFLVQGLAIFFDEFYFHLKRGLPKWERIGHPLDTLSVVACLLYAILAPYSYLGCFGYAALATFSTLFVTKDEWVHNKHCDATEQWLHALLFVNHPIALISAGLMWAKIGQSNSLPTSNWATSWFDSSPLFSPFLTIQFILMALFFFYQIIYWNLLWKKK